MKFDKEANALYVNVKRTTGHRIAQTIPIGNDRFLDLDEDGKVVGIEMILSENTPQDAYNAIKKTIEIES